jgi:O-antigen ligase
MPYTRYSRLFIYIALISPIIIDRSLFFPFITGKALFFRLFIELALVAAIGAVVRREIAWETIRKTIKNKVFLSISIFLGLTFVSSLTAIHPSFAFWSNFERGEGAWQILHYCLLFSLLLIFFRTEGDWRRLIGWQAIISSWVALYAVGQKLANATLVHYGAEKAKILTSWIISPPIGSPLSGSLGNSSYLGGYMLFSAFLTLYLIINTPKGKVRALWMLAFVLQTIMFFNAKTRGSFVALGAGIVIMLVLWAFRKKRVMKHSLALGGTVFLVICGIGYLVLTIKGDALKGLEPRFWTWGSAISGVIEKPLLGWGTENFPLPFDKYYNPHHYGIESWFDRAHNAFLEYATSGGILLLLAYLAIFLTLYKGLWKHENKGPWPLVMALPAIYIVNGLVLFEILPLYILLFFMLAFLVRYGEIFETEGETMHRATAKPQKLAIVIIAIIGIAISSYATIWLPFRKNTLILTALQTNGKTDNEAFKEHYDAIAFSSPVGTQEAVQNLYAFTVGYFEFLRNNDLTKKIPKEKIQTIMANNKIWHEKTAEDAVGLKTEYGYITSLLAAAQTTNDNSYLKEAKELTKKASEASPTRLEFIRFEMAIAVLEKDAKAYELARKKAVVLRPDLPWEASLEKFVY